MKKSDAYSLIFGIPLLFFGLGASTYSEEISWPADNGAALLNLNVGTRPAEPYLTHGWSQNEGDAKIPFRWIRELEADVIFPVEDPGPATLWVHAQPLYLNWKQQKVGVYLNGRYLGSWDYPLEPGYRINRLEIPGKALVSGENRLTLRMGYRSRFKYDSRELALGVHRILIQKKQP
jgi:hypothetical protein